MSFVHLHVHSCYSLLDGAIKVDDLVAAAKKMNMPAVALTDHGQMFGILPFYKAANKAGVKPILGVETYVVADRSRKDQGQSDLRHHLILLAENLAGYRNLCRLISRANIEGCYYGKPRVDKELLARYSEGVIALSACLQGEVPWLLLNRGQAEAERAAGEYAAIFKDRFYLELQHNGLAEQAEANQGLKSLAAKMGLPLVATNDCHYLLKEHYQMADALLALQTGHPAAEVKRLRYIANEYYFKSPAEMAASFADTPEALANTLTIAERCQVEFFKE
jgi:DNA polymerase-3 subunit alpha